MKSVESIRDIFNALLVAKHAPLASLKPCQIPYGLKEVEYKQGFLLGLAKNLATLGEYLLQRPVLVTLAPQGGIYVVDHHHLALALSKENYETVPIKVHRDFSNCKNMEEFWEKMQQANLVYLYDEHGKKKTVADLPNSLADMKDDPYRSLAWFVREAGGYNKIDAPFMEFQWANYFRKNIPLKTVNKDFQKACALAHKLAHDPKAANLPGYKPTSKAKTSATLKKLSLRK